MERIITVNNGLMNITSNDDMLASVLNDIYKNNTCFPEIEDIYEFKKNCKVEGEDGKKVKVEKDALRVFFADGSWTDVVRSDEDKYDRVTAILYAIVKRLFGTPTNAGYVTGNGFMGYLKKLADNVRTEKSDEEAKAERIKAKEEADRKAHEEAVRRREKNPSLGIRLRNLEEKFDALCDLLKEKNEKKSFWSKK